MKICVLGMGHLGVVTAVCLAADGHDVAGLDPDPGVIERLTHGEPPVIEPGLSELLASHPPAFTTDVGVVGDVDVVWLADDTPVDEDDVADIGWVLDRARTALGAARDGVLVIVSSQLPAGTVASLETAHPRLRFACLPENLRLGRAVETFRSPERVVVGTRDEATRVDMGRVLAPYAGRIVWMSIESAELTKHALNAFLATSVSFANELAGICEVTGADMRDVERALRSDPRVGPSAYVAAGPPFSGGTLARDVEYLRALGREGERPTALLDGVAAANESHRGWARRWLAAADPNVAAVWGIAYKPGTESTRRSEAVALCTWLLERDVQVRVHDPLVRILPESLAGSVVAAASPLDATVGADALVVAVASPEYSAVPADKVASTMARPRVLDPAGTTAATLGRHPGIEYTTVGVRA
jgi:UDPglucose 6-dehydrogenase